MAISLTQVDLSRDGPERTARMEPGSVLHFGSKLPEGKRGISLHGPGVAAHHAKLFYSQGQFWLVNLCGLPCSVFKASGRTIFLTAVFPVTDLEVGDAFQIDESTFVIDALSPPLHRGLITVPAADPDLVREIRESAASLDPLTLRPADDPWVPEAALRFAAELNQYLNADEVWRRTVDCVGQVFADRWEDSQPRSLTVATVRLGSAQVIKPLLQDSVPRIDHNPGERLQPTRSRAAEQLLAAAIALPLRDNELLVHRWQADPSGDSFIVLACPIVQEDEQVGSVVLQASWQGNACSAPDTNDQQLFYRLTSTLSLALTFLKQRLAAVEYMQLHDLGSSALETAHDQCHLIDRVDGLIADLYRAIQRLSTANPILPTPMNEPLRRMGVVVKGVQATARSLMRFVRDASRSQMLGQENLPWVDCHQILRDWLSELDWITNDSCLTVTVENQLDERPFWADCDGLLAALRNLHTNACAALKAKPAGPWELRISARISCQASENQPHPALEYLVLTVEDTGCGIPEQQQTLIYRDRIADSASGHGLGTQIIRRTMNEHAGLIRFSSQLDKGTHVELWFPRLKLPAGTPRDPLLRPYWDARQRLEPVVQLPDNALT